ncbi:Hypothetical protein SMAX5B_003224 [Scophthalmus maximus]|uniref:Uncharacterized protein n=1 Tax=Scophthalmus maximus TaxID=52904 RepID=A0A2U9BEC6_SCOMX|nr:Hypothetical protein SMAX5B_003224 [Scophthalmus maximus]
MRVHVVLMMQEASHQKVLVKSTLPEQKSPITARGRVSALSIIRVRAAQRCRTCAQPHSLGHDKAHDQAHVFTTRSSQQKQSIFENTAAEKRQASKKLPGSFARNCIYDKDHEQKRAKKKEAERADVNFGVAPQKQGHRQGSQTMRSA